MILYITTKSTCTTLRVFVICLLWIRVAIRSLITLLGLCDLTISLITFKKLMFLYFVYRVVAILINILFCCADWLIIFNQNCLSVDTILLLAYCILVRRLWFRILPINIFDGTPLIFLLTRACNAWPVYVAILIGILIILTWVAYIEFFIHSITFNLGNEQSLINVIVAKMCASWVINIFLIIVIKIDTLIVDKVIGSIILAIFHMVGLLDIWSKSSLALFSITIAITHSIIIMTCCFEKTLILCVIIETSSLFKVWISLTLLFMISSFSLCIVATMLLRLFDSLLFVWIVVLIHFYVFIWIIY